MNRKNGSLPEDDGSRSAQIELVGVIYDLRTLIAERGVKSEEMIRIAGFFESAKALWLASASAQDPMAPDVLAHRLRILVDICPPELKEYGERLDLGTQILEQSDRNKKQA